MSFCVTGKLLDGTDASVTLFKPGKYWKQRFVSDSARHMNCDYINGDKLHNILDSWFPCEWKHFDIRPTDGTPNDVDCASEPGSGSESGVESDYGM